MEQSQVNEAIVEALRDSSTVSFLASAVSKQLIEQKSKVSNDEEKMVKDHVIFAPDGDVNAKYMISNDIKKALETINPNLVLRTRTLGKALLSSCISVKQTNKGKAYLVTDIVADIKDYVAAPAAAAEDADVSADDDPIDVEVSGKKKSKKDKKKDKKKSSDNQEVQKISPEDAFDAPEQQPIEDVELSVLTAVANDFKDIDEYASFLAGKSRSGLIKHLNKSKLPIRTEGYDDEAVIKAILRLFEANMPILIDEEEVLDEEDISKEVAELPKKKGKKKSKDKAHKIDVAEIEGLSKKGKGNKSKKAKGKKSKK